MEILANNNCYVHIGIDENINDAMNAIVCALILEGYHVKTIRDALLDKAEAMIHEFNLKEE